MYWGNLPGPFAQFMLPHQRPGLRSVPVFLALIPARWTISSKISYPNKTRSGEATPFPSKHPAYKKGGATQRGYPPSNRILSDHVFLRVCVCSRVRAFVRACMFLRSSVSFCSFMFLCALRRVFAFCRFLHICVCYRLFLHGFARFCVFARFWVSLSAFADWLGLLEMRRDAMVRIRFIHNVNSPSKFV